MLLTHYLCTSPVLILPTLVSLLMRHSLQTIVPFGWGRIPMVEPFALLVYDLILSIFVGPFMRWMSYLHAFCASCISLYALLLFFILLLCFSFVWIKNPKPHKKWKIQNVWSYMFEHISLVSLALYLRTNGLMHLWA